MHIYPKRATLLREGLASEIFKLVSYGATPEQWAEWIRVPLEHAAARGNLDLVNTLVGAGADGSAGYRGCRGRTLLDAAAVGGSADVVTALLRAGAQPDVNVVSLPWRRSALYTATVLGHEAVARRLILAGADARFEDLLDRCSVLHEAAFGGHEQLVKELMEAGADPNLLEGRYGSTALHQAADGGHAGVVSALLQRGASKDALCRLGSPLGWAALHGQYTVAETLLAAGADASLRSPTSYLSALDNSARHGHIAVLKAILGHGADVNARDIIGRTAIHHAAMNQKVDAIDALVEAGADIELKGFFEQTILYSAASMHKISSVRALLKRGAGIEARDYRGRTPLHGACETTRYPCLEGTVDLLLRWGADETALDRSGRTPADFLGSSVLSNAQCSEQEIQRTRLLLARAPADRAWRRRRWLVMLRWRDSKAAAAAGSGSRGSGAGGISTAAADGRAGGKVARTSSTGHSPHGPRNNGGVGVEAGAEIGGGNLSSLVAQLLGLELDGVFRTVVGFL